MKFKTSLFPADKHAIAGIQGGLGRWYPDSDSRNVSNEFEIEITSFAPYDLEFTHNNYAINATFLPGVTPQPDYLWVHNYKGDGTFEMRFDSSSTQDRMVCRLTKGQCTFVKLTGEARPAPSAWLAKQVGGVGTTNNVKIMLVYI